MIKEIPKYTVGNCGTEEDKNGSYVKIEDILILLDYCLDDDSKIQERVLNFKEKLKNN